MLLMRRQFRVFCRICLFKKLTRNIEIFYPETAKKINTSNYSPLDEIFCTSQPIETKQVA